MTLFIHKTGDETFTGTDKDDQVQVLRDSDFLLTDTKLQTLGSQQHGTFSSGAINWTIPHFNLGSSFINVSQAGTIVDMNVNLNIAHKDASKLNVSLGHGEELLQLASLVGTGGSNFTNTVFDDEAKTAIITADAPFTGSYRPQQALSQFDDAVAKGAWGLFIVDIGFNIFKVGKLKSWSIDVTTATAETSKLIDIELAKITAGVSANKLDATSFTGNVELYAGAGNDNILGGKGSDFLAGQLGNDVLKGGNGADTLDGGAGNDVLDGGNDIDIADYSSAIKAVRVNLNITSKQNTLGAGFDTLTNIEYITGSKFNDVLTGNAKQNRLMGDAGNDVLNGGAGIDVLVGGAGNDTYIVDVKSDKIIEAVTAGIDTVKTAVNWSLGQNLENLVLTGKENLNAIGNKLVNKLVGNNANNILNSGAGNDVIIANAGADKLIGGLGNDILQGGSGNDTYMFGLGMGQDRINDVAGSMDRLFLNGLRRQDVDFEVVNNTDLKVNLKASDDSVYIKNGANSDVGIGIESFKFSDQTIDKTEALQIKANVVVNRISPNANTSEGNALNDNSLGDKVVYAVKLAAELVPKTFVTLNFASNDISEGKVITKSLMFNASNWNKAQKLVIQGVDDRLEDGSIPYHIEVTVDDNIKKTNALAYVENDVTIANIELINIEDKFDAALTNQFGFKFANDTIYTSENNFIIGRNGDDTLSGGDRGDNIKGGYGNDNLSGDKHNDLLYGEQGDDVIKGGEHDDKLYGDVGNDKLYGEQDNDVLFGGAGNDWLDGGIGIDKMYGGAGSDTYVKDHINDVINDIGSAKDIDAVHVLVTGSKTGKAYTYFLDNNIENAEITAIKGNGGLVGNKQNNLLIGNAGKNVIKGLAGNDILNGSTGADILVGGAGKDIFQLDNLAGVDSIKDFNVPADSIQLENSVFSSIGQAGILAATKFRIGTSAQDANDNIIYNKNTGELFYDADGKGGAEAVEIAILGAGLALTNADFLII